MSRTWHHNGTGNGGYLYGRESAKDAPRLVIVERLDDSGNWVIAGKSKRRARMEKLHEMLRLDGQSARLLAG